MTKKELIEFICEMYNIEECSPLILGQIHKYVMECRYDYLDIARALSYFIDVLGNQTQLKYGIGIVPHVMTDAKKYFEKLKLQKNSQIMAAKMAKNNKSNTQVIHCQLESKKTIRKHQININTIN